MITFVNPHNHNNNEKKITIEILNLKALKAVNLTIRRLLSSIIYNNVPEILQVVLEYFWRCCTWSFAGSQDLRNQEHRRIIKRMRSADQRGGRNKQK